MKLLLVQATSTGGVGRHVAEVAGGVARAGHAVIVAGPPQARSRLSGLGVRGPHPRENGVPGFVPVDIADRPRAGADVRAVAILRRLVRGADVVHAHGLRAGALTALALTSTGHFSTTKRPRFVVTLHNAPMGDQRVHSVGAGLLAVIVARADLVMGVSADLVEAASSAGARQVATALVPVPVPQPPELDEVWRVRSELLSHADDPTGEIVVVLAVARLAPQKGLERLVEAAALLRRSLAPAGRTVVCAIAGDGPLRDSLRRQARVVGAPVVLLGARDDVPALLRAADVVVLPSRWEGQPLVAQEAMHAGAALIATDVGGTAAVTGHAAQLVLPDSAPALAAAIAEAVTTAGRLDQMRERSRQRAAQLPTTEAMITQLVTRYRTLVS